MYEFKKEYDFPIVVKSKAYLKDETVYSYHPFFNKNEFGEWKAIVVLMQEAEEKYEKDFGEILEIKEYGMTEAGIAELEKDYKFFYNLQ